MINAVLFDFDGTLVNTNPLIIRTLKETFAALLPSRVLSDTEILDCIGPTLAQTGQKYFPENPDKFVDYYRKLNLTYHDEMIQQYPGIADMLAELHRRGLVLAVVSSKKRDLVLHGLQLMGLSQYFDYVLGGDEVENPKPHPEPITTALTALGLAANETMMVGDNSHDIECAQNAGVVSVGVGWAERGADYLRAFHPDYVINSPAELLDIVARN